MDTLPLILLLVATAAGVVAWNIRSRSRHRQRVVRELLDAADGLEARLRAARSEIEAIAGEHENPVRAAMQELLRQRLWLQEQAADADLGQLQAVRNSLDEARASLERQLQRVAQARSGGA